MTLRTIRDLSIVWRFASSFGCFQVCTATAGPRSRAWSKSSWRAAISCLRTTSAFARRSVDSIRSIDFADVLMGEVNRARGCEVTATFDRKAAKLEGFVRVG